MTTIKAIVRNGRIEIDQPLDLPDGTELTIPIPSSVPSIGIPDENWSDTPEAIEAWIQWYDSLKPLDFDVRELAAWEAARDEQKQYELAQWEHRSKRIEEHFP